MIEEKDKNMTAIVQKPILQSVEEQRKSTIPLGYMQMSKNRVNLDLVQSAIFY